MTTHSTFTQEYLLQESIPVGCVAAAFLIPGSLLTEILDRDPPGRKMGPGTEAPRRNMASGSQTGSDREPSPHHHHPVDRQTGGKTLPCPKLRLQAVRMTTLRISAGGTYPLILRGGSIALKVDLDLLGLHWDNLEHWHSNYLLVLVNYVVVQAILKKF